MATMIMRTVQRRLPNMQHRREQLQREQRAHYSQRDEGVCTQGDEHRIRTQSAN